MEDCDLGGKLTAKQTHLRLWAVSADVETPQ